MEIGVVLIIWIILCFVAGSIAENKGNSALAAFLISLVLSPLIGIVIALAEKPNEAVLEKKRLKSGESRKCPFCAELIKKDATVCRYCGRDVGNTATQPVPRAATVEEPKQAIPAQKSGMVISLLAAGLVAVAIIFWAVTAGNTKSGQHISLSPTNVKKLTATSTPQKSPEIPVEAKPSPPSQSNQQPKLADKAASEAKPPPPFVTLTQSVSIRSGVIPVGTRLEVAFRQGDDLHIRFAGGEYVIPISPTDLK
jgi:hypothetical protein